jgi:hypothetical protein
MADVYNWDFFQIPHTGVDSSTYGDAVVTRKLDAKMSNFGALNRGSRMSVDYTRTVLAFKSKDELTDWSYLSSVEQDANVDVNPYVANSTVKRIRDDQLTRLGMENEDNAENKGVLPDYDVSATKLANSGMEVPKKYPSEGWSSFGGKYDFAVVYQG